MSAKRYKLEQPSVYGREQGDDATREEDAAGNSVTHDDYAALEARNADLEKALLTIVKYDPVVSDYRVHQGMRQIAIVALGHPPGTDPDFIDGPAPRTTNHTSGGGDA